MLVRILLFALTVIGLAVPLGRCEQGGAFQRWAAGRKRALIVGIEGYSDSRIPPAKFADRDADALGKALKTALKANMARRKAQARARAATQSPGGDRAENGKDKEKE